MAGKKNEVATTAGFDVSTLSAGAVPDFLKDKMGEGRGNEGVSSDDMTVPRLELVQSLSEVRKKASPNYIEGIQEGDLYNNVTREVYGESVLFVRRNDGYVAARAAANHFRLSRIDGRWQITSRTTHALDGKSEARQLLSTGALA